jgi:hypothetical protein
MAGLAEFERDLIRERVKSGLAGAKARGVKLGRQKGHRPSDKKAKQVLARWWAVPPDDRPQCRPEQEHGDGHRQAGGCRLSRLEPEIKDTSKTATEILVGERQQARGRYAQALVRA